MHKHLGAIVGGCKMLGGTAAFYVCQPDFSIAALPSAEVVRWTLTGAARSSNGRKDFRDDHGVAQVVLENALPFGTSGPGGVIVSGRLSAGTIVVFAFAPTPSALRGYAVWRLRSPARFLRVRSTGRGSGAALDADAKRLRPVLVISPSHELRAPALRAIFADDIRHLEAIAKGDVSGACAFYGAHSSGDDAACARAIGVRGEAAAVARSTAAARQFSYNGYTLAMSKINGQAVTWILTDGHFRFVTSNITD